MDAQEEQKKLNTDLDTRLDDLARANMALYESDKTKGDFLSTVSHELRTPLHGIIGFSDVLLSSASPLSEKQARWVANIKTSGQQLLTLINDILDLAKIEAGKMELRPEEFAIPEFCDSLLTPFRLPAEKKNIDLHVQYDPNLPTIRQDAGKVRQILTNLISNAIKFTPEGGHVNLRVAPDGDFVVFTVADTGVGIPSDEHDRVYEKFRQAGRSTLTREHEGTGLGLSIVRELCGLLGGEVSLKSDLGRGSTFTVRFPQTLPGSADRSVHRDRTPTPLPSERPTATAAARAQPATRLPKIIASFLGPTRAARVARVTAPSGFSGEGGAMGRTRTASGEPGTLYFNPLARRVDGRDIRTGHDEHSAQGAGRRLSGGGRGESGKKTTTPHPPARKQRYNVTAPTAGGARERI